jgi:hypothetical protein
VGRVLRPLEFFVEAPVRVIADENPEAIPVEDHGQAVALREAPQQREIAVQVFGGAEVQGHAGARRVVDGADEECAGAGAEPVELAAVDEDERAFAARRGRRARCWGGRCRRLGGRPRARRSRWTVLRLTRRPSSSWSFSVQWQSFSSR